MLDLFSSWVDMPLTEPGVARVIEAYIPMKLQARKFGAHSSSQPTTRAAWATRTFETVLWAPILIQGCARSVSRVPQKRPPSAGHASTRRWYPSVPPQRPWTRAKIHGTSSSPMATSAEINTWPGFVVHHSSSSDRSTQVYHHRRAPGQHHPGHHLHLQSCTTGLRTTAVGYGKLRTTAQHCEALGSPTQRDAHYAVHTGIPIPSQI